MSLIFSSGGGRLGNQLLNLIHLSAISYEYDIEIYKISDLFIFGKNKSLIYKIERNFLNWKIVFNINEINNWDKYILKIFIRLIHLYYYFLPNKFSYKLGSGNNLPKFIIGNNLKTNFSKLKLISEAKKYNVVLSGWGFRDWDLVLKHKELIIQNFHNGFSSIINNDKKIVDDYLFVHIRRSDFLEVDEFKELNFTDEIWLKSILRVCEINSLKKVVIFSDSHITDFMISFLKSHKIKVIVKKPCDTKNNSFLEQFISYLSNANSVICNASTLVLSLSFLYHEKIYLPSKNKDFQNIFLSNAHYSYPTSLNWN